MLGSILAAGGNLIGGILGSRDKAKDRSMQKEFAQHGIRWKVEDAKAAGLHPLAALGAQVSSYAPVSVGSPGLGEGLAAAGQDVSRAINATRSSGERVDAYTKSLRDLSLQKMGLENQLLASQIAKINQAGTPPALPGAGDRYLIDGQGNSPLVESSELKRTVSAPGAGSQEPGAIPDVGYARTPSGFAPVMSKDVKDRLEEDWIGSLLWNIRNRLAPTVGNNRNRPGAEIGADEYWSYSPMAKEDRITKRHRGPIGMGRYSYRRR